MTRLGQAIGTKSYLQGWHNTSLLGGIAATFAGGYLLAFSAALGLWFKRFPFCTAALHDADAAGQLAQLQLPVQNIASIAIWR